MSSMTGSGFDSYTIAMTVDCPNEKCKFDGLTDVFVDDDKNYWFKCDKCDFDDRLKDDVPF
jgi:hypothetical protein